MDMAWRGMEKVRQATTVKDTTRERASRVVSTINDVRSRVQYT